MRVCLKTPKHFSKYRLRLYSECVRSLNMIYGYIPACKHEAEALPLPLNTRRGQDRKGGGAGSRGTLITLARCLTETACRLAGLHNREQQGSGQFMQHLSRTGGSCLFVREGAGVMPPEGGRVQTLPVSLGWSDSSERLEDYIWNPVR